MFQDGARYVVNSADTLYYLPNSSCSEGSQITIPNTQVIRFRLVNNNWLASDVYTTGNISNTSYYCHVYSSDSDIKHNPDSFILPGVIIMVCFFTIIYHWFLRLRG